MLVGDDIIHTDAQDPGVEALIEIKLSIMRFHLSRSNGCESSREEGHDEMVFSIVVLVIIHQPILG